ncbi:MAG: hypothetical protein Kow0074_07650 [Candidatus Zixiibacteriota bacterium]
MDPHRIQRPETTRQTRESGDSSKVRRPETTKPEVANLHQDASLRDKVADLIERGDLDASTDGRVREGRVEQARRNRDHGTYNDYQVLSDVVDRLLNQWNI